MEDFLMRAGFFLGKKEIKGRKGKVKWFESMWGEAACMYPLTHLHDATRLQIGSSTNENS
jgi:hypothetical protein